MWLLDAKQLHKVNAEVRFKPREKYCLNIYAFQAMDLFDQIIIRRKYLMGCKEVVDGVGNNDT